MNTTHQDLLARLVSRAVAFDPELGRLYSRRQLGEHFARTMYRLRVVGALNAIPSEGELHRVQPPPEIQT